MLFPDYQNLSMIEIKSKISRLQNLGKPEQAFLCANITDWQRSKEREMMLTAQSYYKNDNDIKDRKRWYIDRKGVKQEVQNLSNNKLAHPYLRQLTNQKVNYLLAKQPSIESENETFNDLLATYLDKKFFRMFKNVGKDAIVNGIAWLQVYYDEEGVLKFKRIPSEEIIPFWSDADHTELSAIIRVYSIVQFSATGVKEEINKVEYMTSSGTWYYVWDKDGLKPDPKVGPEAKGHFVAVKEEVDENGQPIMNEYEATWGKVPFIGFKYNSDEISLLKWIKPLLDDYDTNTSDTSNNLQDVPNSIKVVRAYDGTDKGEFVQNLATFRTAFVDHDGDVTSLSTPLDVTAIEAHLTRLKHDIYEAGNGVDTQNENLGNASGVALKFRFSGLDNDVQEMANEFTASMEQLLWFIKTDMLNKGLGNFMDVDFEIVFNTDMIVNESEVIANAKASVGVVSDETILANHPWVTDVQQEIEKVTEQKQKAIEEQQSMMITEAEISNMNFGTDKPAGSNKKEDDK